MNRNEIMDNLADWFGIEADEHGEYNIDDYEWRTGVSIGKKFLCLAEVVRCIEAMQ